MNMIFVQTNNRLLTASSSTTTRATDAASIAAELSVCQAYTTSLEQRRLFTKLAPPPIRLELVSPYTQNPNLTSYDLDMRRKAEILQYNGNRMSTRVGNMTKKQKTAAALRGTFGNRPGPTCTSDLYIISSTDACDVPGPIQPLFFNPAIPLYNFKSTSSSLENPVGTGTQTNDVVLDEPWKAVVDDEVAFPMVINGSIVPRRKIAYLVIYQTIMNPVTTYSFVIPVVLRVQGLVRSNPPAQTIIEAEVVSPPIVEICYNNQVVTTNEMQITANFTTVTWSAGHLEMDTAFFAEQFIGNIRVHNVKISTQPYYVFEIRVGISISETSPIPFSTFRQLYTAYANISPDFVLSDPNQIFTNPECEAAIQPFQILDDSNGSVIFPE